MATIHQIAKKISGQYPYPFEEVKVLITRLIGVSGKRDRVEHYAELIIDTAMQNNKSIEEVTNTILSVEIKPNKMNNPRVYPSKKQHPARLLCHDHRHDVNLGIDLLTHVATEAMKPLWASPDFEYSELDEVAKKAFDMAEAFLTERETRLNQK